MKKKYFIAMFLFLLINTTYAFDAELKTDKKDISKNELFTLEINIESEDGESLEIEEIKGLENFEIVGQNQSQSSSTYVSLVEGEAKTISKTINSIILTLAPKGEGKFALGPAIIKKDDDEKKETKSVEIGVSGEKNTLKIQSSNNKIGNLNENISQKYEKKDSYESELPYKYTIYFLTLFLVFILLLVLVVMYNRGKKVEENEKEFDDENFDGEIDINKYPSLEDEKFSLKIEKIFQAKISKKYKIDKIDKKSYEEILDLVGNEEEKENLRRIFDILYKLKYSNILITKIELVELIKKV